MISGNPRIVRPHLNNRGMALLLVISVISLLTVIILQFSRSMQFHLVESSRYQERIVLESIAQSGLDIGIAVLRADRDLNDYDSLLDSWALLKESPLVAPFSPAQVSLTITDLDGRFPINRLVAVAREGQNPGPAGGEGLSPEQARAVLLRLLDNGSFVIETEAEAIEIVDSIVDWIDPDDEELPYGAESSYYESLEKPYKARNGLVEFVDELLLVRGITAELLYGTDETSGLADYINVGKGDGKININTVELPVLQALDDRISAEDVENIEAYRTDETSYDMLANSSWYLDVDGWPGDIVIDDNVLTTRGSYFLVTAVARHQESSMKMSSVVKRTGEDKLEFVFVKID
jgi:general secretion pathway protein K